MAQVTINIYGTDVEADAAQVVTKDDVTVLVEQRVNQALDVIDWSAISRICEMVESMPQTIERIVDDKIAAKEGLDADAGADILDENDTQSAVASHPPNKGL